MKSDREKVVDLSNFLEYILKYWMDDPDEPYSTGRILKLKEVLARNCSAYGCNKESKGEQLCTSWCGSTNCPKHI